VKELNLSGNELTTLPEALAESLPDLESLNLNNNKLESVFATVDVLALFPRLINLFINLVTEEEVDYVLKQLPGLNFLNGLGVDREELEEAF